MLKNSRSRSRSQSPSQPRTPIVHQRDDSHFPLTSANLRLLGEISSPSNSPPQTPGSMASSITSASHSANIAAIRQVLANNRMKINDSDARERNPQLMKWASDVVQGERHSAMKPGSEKRAAKTREEFELSNEDTFLAEYLKIIVKAERMVNVSYIDLTNVEVQHSDASTPEIDAVLAKDLEWITQSFLDDHLRPNYNQVFLPSSIPALDTANSDPVTIQLLNQKENRVTKPKPDVVYGLGSSAFSSKEHLVQQTLSTIVRISPNISHPFFILEAKGAEGSMQAAENQACRAGAALVRSHRQLYEYSGTILAPVVPTQAERSVNTSESSQQTPARLPYPAVAFSLCLIPQHASLWIHWAEGEAEGTTYHMHRLHAYILTASDAAKQLRHDIHNILDWGVLNWKAEVKYLLSEIERAIIVRSQLTNSGHGATPAKRRKISAAPSESTRS